MAKGNVTVTKQTGAGVSLTGKDHYMGLVMYLPPAAYPAGIIRSWAVGLTVVDGDYFESPIDFKVYVGAAGTTSGANAAADPLMTEVTDTQTLAEARTAQVTIANMETLGITEGSNADVVYYQLKYYFEKNPNGFVWLRPADEGLGTVTFDEIDDIVTVSNGDVRKIGVYNNGNDAVFAAAHCVSLHTKYAEYVSAKTPVHIAYFPTSYTETYDNFIDLKDQGAYYGVAVYNLYDFKKADAAYPAMGVALGFWAQSKVSESIGWVEKYNFVSTPDGSNNYAEFDSIGVLDSSGFVSNATLKGAAEDLLDDKGWNILVKYEDQAGSYVNDMITVSADGNDFEAVYYVVTLDKAARGIRASLVPKINSELILNPDGTLSDTSVHIFTDLAKSSLDVMVAAGELTLDQNPIVIPTDQNVGQTKTLEISANVLLNGVAKTITVSLSRIKAQG